MDKWQELFINQMNEHSIHPVRFYASATSHDSWFEGRALELSQKMKKAAAQGKRNYRGYEIDTKLPTVDTGWLFDIHPSFGRSMHYGLFITTNGSIYGCDFAQLFGDEEGSTERNKAYREEQSKKLSRYGRMKYKYNMSALREYMEILDYSPQYLVWLSNGNYQEKIQTEAAAEYRLQRILSTGHALGSAKNYDYNEALLPDNWDLMQKHQIRIWSHQF